MLERNQNRHGKETYLEPRSDPGLRWRVYMVRMKRAKLLLHFQCKGIWGIVRGCFVTRVLCKMKMLGTMPSFGIRSKSTSRRVVNRASTRRENQRTQGRCDRGQATQRSNPFQHPTEAKCASYHINVVKGRSRWEWTFVYRI